MQTQQPPAIVVTNYQQYINAEFLQQGIIDGIDPEFDGALPEAMYASIAYFTVNKTGNLFKKTQTEYVSNLTLSINGKSHTFVLHHSDDYIYDANKRLVVNEYTNNEQKDADMRALQSAFETLVFMRIDKITQALVNSYKPKQS